MNNIERQTLRNESTILMALSELGVSDITLIAINNRLEEMKLLTDPKEQEDCCEMPEEDEIFANVSKSEVKGE